jgi:uncharacterized secreted protein with C-terminal beta-propeller domain
VKILAWCSTIAALVGVAVGLQGLDGDTSPGDLRRLGGVELAAAPTLEPFSDCRELLTFFRAGSRRGAADRAAPAPAGATAEAVVGGDAGGEEAGPFSGTNLQEPDVDEPDVVKTDGEVIVTVAGSELHVIDPGAGRPALLGTAPIPGEASSEILLTGDRVTVFSRTDGGSPAGGVATGAPVAYDEVAWVGSPQTTVTSVDISAPTAPRVVETRTFDGDHVSVRMTGTLARVVLRAAPAGPARPEVGGTVEDASLEAWLPGDEDGPVVACDAVSRPAEPAGTGMLTVLTIDVTSSLEPVDATAVVADAETVYASRHRLYVSTTSWPGCCDGAEPGEGAVTGNEVTVATTDIHAFDTTGAATTYLGSGRVEGHLLNSFSLSEHRGILRVATTSDPPDGPSESAVVTLAEEGGALVPRGRLAGLGTTEQIYAVRYQGDVAYVVTFRQVDPLYTLDLSDPAAPRLLGELKIPGYSAYLHPVEEGRLIGVGQDATDEGVTEGTQLSTFDVGDLAGPREEDRISFAGGWSPVEHDHQAFLWWAPDRVAVVPLEVHPHDPTTGVPTGESFTGAVVVDVGPDGQLRERGRVSHQDHVPGDHHAVVRRAVVIGDVLYTLSDAGILASDLDGLGAGGWLGR